MKRLKLLETFIIISCCLQQIFASLSTTRDSHVLVFPEQLCGLKAQATSTNKGSSVDIYQMRVKAAVRNRFAQTTVTSKVRNCHSSPKEAIFSVILPESAFISGFVMEVNGRNYTAYVTERHDAQKTYDQAVTNGLGAAHVAASTRDSNRITVTVNVEPDTNAAFYLTYEELLQRSDDCYELVVNLHPGQPVVDLSVEVEISESKAITKLTAPPLRTGKAIDNSPKELDPAAFIQNIDRTTAKVAFSPSLSRQQNLAELLGSEDEASLSGQFVVQYDVERDQGGGEVLIEDGYFVHFFAPTQLSRLPKHIVFVLDSSTSMAGTKLLQLKEAMFKILDDLGSDDVFHLITFSVQAKVWLLTDSYYSVSYAKDDTLKLTADSQLLGPCSATPGNIQKAKVAVSQIKAQNQTNIYAALRVAIRLVNLAKWSSTTNHQPMIIFLTDGVPIVGETSTEKIVKEVTKLNNALGKIPIFALSLGTKAKRSFLQDLSLKNYGFSRHIYESADTSLQLQGFYRQVSSPELSDIAFRYQSSIKNLTQFKFPLHFRGGELVTAGRYDATKGRGSFAKPVVNAWNGEEDVSFQPTVQEFSSNIERVWAYLTVKQLLEKSGNSVEDQEKRNRQAVDLALKYSIVTPVTSMVVVKPDSTMDVNLEPVPDELIVPKVALFSRFEDDSASTKPLGSKCANGIINLPKGSFKLGLNETIPGLVKCSNSLLNSQGHCRLIHSCLTNGLAIRTDDYIDHFCEPRKGYAGICCPDNWYKEKTFE